MTTLKSLLKRGVEQEEIIELMEDELQWYVTTGDIYNVNIEERQASTDIHFNSAGRSWSVVFQYNEPASIFVSSALDGAEPTDPKELRSINAAISFIKRVAGI